MKWAELVAHMGEKRNSCTVLMEKSEGRRPVGRTRCRWEVNVRIDL